MAQILFEENYHFVRRKLSFCPKEISFSFERKFLFFRTKLTANQPELIPYTRPTPERIPGARFSAKTFRQLIIANDRQDG